jgi:hypothetical protein
LLPGELALEAATNPYRFILLSGMPASKKIKMIHHWLLQDPRQQQVPNIHRSGWRYENCPFKVLISKSSNIKLDHSQNKRKVCHFLNPHPIN